jgi:hypothetical protein
MTDEQPRDPGPPPVTPQPVPATPTESPFDQPDVMTGYPLEKDEQERVDRLVEESAKEADQR